METLGPFKGVYRDIIPIMENQMEKKMENGMETGIIMGYVRVILGSGSRIPGNFCLQESLDKTHNVEEPPWLDM